MMLTGEMLRRSADRFPDKPAIVCGERSMSYRELDGRANRLAHALLALDLGKGGKIAILARNIIEYGIVFFGAARTGYVLNNLSLLHTVDELAYAIEKTDVEALIFDAAVAADVAALLPRVAGRLKKVVSIGAAEGLDAVDFDAFIADRPTHHPDVALDERDPFCMTYTGGTTGRPKGVLCDHRARAVTTYTSMIEQMIDERDVVGVVTPLYHIAALHLTFQPAILAGATSVFLPKWSPEGFLEIAERHGVTTSFMVPTQATRLLSDPAFDPERLESWKKANFAGAPMPDWVQIELMRIFPELMITQNYGQSEMGMVAVLRHWYLPEKLGAVGRQAINVDIRVVRPDGTPVEPGEVGEIVSRGDNLMREYYGEPEQTAEFFRHGDGWGWSGDLAQIDKDGFITLVDRSKDMIISGGENLFPKEIEIVLYELAEVGECAVFGIPDEVWGEVPAAFISLKSGAILNEQRVLEHCSVRLARFKRPRLVRFVTEFPKTPVGKIQKNVLREEFWSDRDKRI
jgi:acyl-CoA synthetase (AMP-forming)/AMP-acid ligase II